MRSLIADIYKVIYIVTHHKPFSFFCALLYVSTINMIILYGIMQLLSDWNPGMAVAAKLLITFPYNVFIAGSMMFIMFLMMLPLRYLSKHMAQHLSVITIVVYSSLPLLVLLYAKYLYNLF